jgi:hypothetical protein
VAEPNLIECDRHGRQQETFVCQHILNSLRTRKAVGFFWPAEAVDEERPDARCSDCDRRVQKTGGDWIGEAAEHLGLTLLCASCYDEAKAINFPNGFPPRAG